MAIKACVEKRGEKTTKWVSRKPYVSWFIEREREREREGGGGGGFLKDIKPLASAVDRRIGIRHQFGSGNF